MLFKKGLGAGIIINKIKTSKTNFDVSTDALIQLKTDGIPDEIVASMVEYAGSSENAVTDENNPLSRHSSGIYYFNPLDSIKRLARLDPTVVSSNKQGGFGTAVAQHYTSGLVNSNSVSSISGSNARKQLRDPNPVFYFYFDKNKSGLNQTTNWWFMTASSPNEFALVSMRPKKDSREIVIGQSNAYGSSMGINEKQKVSFDYEEVAENIYKVVMRGSLKPGEYCFMFTGATPSVYKNDKVFDFGIF
jgi:hypothetical protein